jgi:hypothetical protein
MSTTRFLTAAALVALVLTGCQTIDPQIALRREAMRAAIAAEPAGDYFVARRFYKSEYKIWGWVRRPGQPWSTARLVMLNESQMLAPDRTRNDIGYDNNFEYTLRGRFSGDTIYEPSSNRFFPEFVLTGIDLRSTSPASIFSDPRSTDPTVRLLTPPI